MDNKAKEILHSLVLDVINDHCKIIQDILTQCIHPITTVKVVVDTDTYDKDSIVIVFDNPVLEYTLGFDLDSHINACVDASVNIAIRAIVMTALKAFSDKMFDIFLKDPKEVEKIIKILNNSSN